MMCSVFGLNCASQAFDSVHDNGVRGVANGNFWHSARTGMPQWVQYDFQRQVKLCSYAIVARHAHCCVEEDSPHVWELQGTNDGGFWDSYSVVDNRTKMHWSSEERAAFVVIPSGSFRWYRLFITATGTNQAAVIAELELYEIVNNDSYTCSSSDQKWSETPASNFYEDHIYTLELHLNGTINFAVDGILQRTWVDTHYNYGIIGAGSQCAESTITSIVVSQLCEITVHIHINTSAFEGQGGMDTRWNLDRMPEWEYGPYDESVADHFHNFEVTSGTHTLNAYAILFSSGWHGGYWEILDKHGVAFTTQHYVTGRGSSTDFKVACGYSSQIPTDTRPCSSCPPGSIAHPDCLGARSLPLTLESTVCAKCPPGKFSTAWGATSCISCPVGQYAFEGSTECGALCPSGFAPDYSAVCTRACARCPAGQFSDGASGCQPCEVGRAASIATSSCQLCTPGKFTDSTGLAECTRCPGGRYSPFEEAAVCISCGPGEFAFPGSPQCTPCLAGKYTAEFEAPGVLSCIDCRPGRYAAADSSVACHTCELGYYATAGQAACTICGQGTYSAVKIIVGGSIDGQFWGTGAGGFPSIGGQFSVGAGHPDNCTLCPGGKFSAAFGAAECALCDPGRYSLPGSTFCRACPAGTASFARGSWTCAACDPGRFAPVPASTTCELCGTGQYTTETSNNTFTASSCHALKRTQDNECAFIITTSARLGYVCDSDLTFAGFPGQTLEDFCPGSCGTCLVEDQTNNSFGLLTGPIECQLCPIGTSSRTTGATSPSVCQACGSDYVDNDHDPRTPCVACIPGRYADHIENECQRCRPGQADVDRIPSTSCTLCPVGTYSGFGSFTCDLCPSGSADTDLDSSTECVECSPGKHGAEGAVACEDCAAGYYDDDADARTACLVCAVGQYSSGDRSPCELCPAGYADDDRNPATPCAKCPAGSYLPQGSTLCIPCPAGTVDADSNAASPCTRSCRAGTYAAPGSWQCAPCPSGTQDADSNAATPCTTCRSSTCAVAGSTACGPCMSTVHGSFTVAGMIPKSAVVSALNDIVPDGTSVSGGNVVQQVEPVYISINKRGHRPADYVTDDSLRGTVFKYGVAYALLNGRDPVFVPADDIRIDILDAFAPLARNDHSNMDRRRTQSDSLSTLPLTASAPMSLSLDFGVTIQCRMMLTSTMRATKMDIVQHLTAGVNEDTGGKFLEHLAIGINKKQTTRDVVRAAAEAEVPLFRIDSEMISVVSGDDFSRNQSTYTLVSSFTYVLSSTQPHSTVASTLGRNAIDAAIRAAIAPLAVAFNLTDVSIQPAPPLPSEPSNIAVVVVLLLLAVTTLSVSGFYGRKWLKKRAAQRQAELDKINTFSQPEETEDERMAREMEEERQKLSEETRGLREAQAAAEVQADKIRRETEAKIKEKKEREMTWQADKARRIIEKQEALEAAQHEHAAERERVLARLVALNTLSKPKTLALENRSSRGSSRSSRSERIKSPHSDTGSPSSSLSGRGVDENAQFSLRGSLSPPPLRSSPERQKSFMDLGSPVNFRDRLAKSTEAIGASDRGVDKRYRHSGAQGGGGWA